MPTLQKTYYYGSKALFPQEITKGNVLYDPGTNELFIDTDDERKQVNVQPVLGTASSRNATSTLAENSQDLPTSGAVYDAINDLEDAIVNYQFEVDENGHLVYKQQ